MKVIYTLDGNVSVVSFASQEAVAALVPEVGDMTELEYADWIIEACVPEGATDVGVVEDEDAPVDYEAQIAAAKARIFMAYERTYKAWVESFTGEPYSQADISNWPMQEAESYDYIQNDVAAITPWLDAYSVKTGVTKNALALATAQRQLWNKTIYIGLTAIRYDALAAIDALGASPTPAALNAIVDAVEWPEYTA